MKNESDKSLDEILAEFDIDSARKKEPKDWTTRRGITFHLTPEYKAKYEKLQDLTHCEFGKKVKEIIMRSIDKKLESAS